MRDGLPTIGPQEARDFLVEQRIEIVEDYRGAQQFCEELTTLGEEMSQIPPMEADEFQLFKASLHALRAVNQERLAVFRFRRPATGPQAILAE